jgi:hypothetical protein
MKRAEDPCGMMLVPTSQRFYNDRHKGMDLQSHLPPSKRIELGVKMFPMTGVVEPRLTLVEEVEIL